MDSDFAWTKSLNNMNESDLNLESDSLYIVWSCYCQILIVVARSHIKTSHAWSNFMRHCIVSKRGESAGIPNNVSKSHKEEYRGLAVFSEERSWPSSPQRCDILIEYASRALTC